MNAPEIEPRLSRMAIWGLILSVAVYPLGFVAFLMVGPCHPPTDWRGTAGPFLGLMALASMATGVLLGLIAPFRIARSKGRLWGTPVALLGLGASGILAAILVLTILG
jgi:hypothetical protein